MQKLVNIFPGIFMILISLIIFMLSINIPKQNILDPSGGSFFPSLVALMMTISGIITIYKDYKQLSSKSTDDQPANVYNVTEANRQINKDVIYFIFSFFLFIFLLQYFSFFLVAFLFLIFAMYFLKGIGWKVNVFVSMITVLLIYIIFSNIFKIVFP